MRISGRRVKHGPGATARPAGPEQQRSGLNAFHAFFGISRTADRQSGKPLLYFVQFRIGQDHIRGGGILAQIAKLPGARNRNDIVTLSQQPCQRKLGRAAPFAQGNRTDEIIAMA